MKDLVRKLPIAVEIHNVRKYLYLHRKKQTNPWKKTPYYLISSCPRGAEFFTFCSLQENLLPHFSAYEGCSCFLAHGKYPFFHTRNRGRILSSHLFDLLPSFLSHLLLPRPRKIITFKNRVINWGFWVIQDALLISRSLFKSHVQSPFLYNVAWSHEDADFQGKWGTFLSYPHQVNLVALKDTLRNEKKWLVSS